MTALTKVKINEKQENFLDNLISNGGNITKACVDAGYSPNTTNWLMRKLKDEIIERTKLYQASAGVKAANRIIEALDADGSIPANGTFIYNDKFSFTGDAHLDIRAIGAVDILVTYIDQDWS